MSKVKVAVRVRPFNRREIQLGGHSIVDMDGNQTILSCPISSGHTKLDKKPRTFAFDHCFWSMDKAAVTKYSGQKEVFDNLGGDMLGNTFDGYNACIFAYGQTGSGKSYTMMGAEGEPGLIPMLCSTMFEMIVARQCPALSCKVEVAFMEIYNERVRDLLDPRGRTNLRVREHKILGPYVDGLSQLAVSDYQDIESLMEEGNKSRTVAATNMNSESSRSHAVFSIILTQVLTDLESGTSGERVSKLSLVDLAGSERAAKSGAVGDRLKEGSNINKSLTTLGLVISALADQSSKKKTQNLFVPYRDSVLTWILKDNLGGNSKTVMVATLSPSADNFEETLSTLRFADRAKRIVNHAVINEDPNAKLIRELREEVDRLRLELQEAKSLQQSQSLYSLRSSLGETPTVEQQLAETEKLMEELGRTWEEKLEKTEEIHKQRQKVLENMGISVQQSGIRVEHDRAFLVNLNADPSLNELLVYYLKERTLIGRPGTPSDTEIPHPNTPPSPDIQLSGLGIMDEHAVITIEDNDVYMEPLAFAWTCVNGHVTKQKTLLRHGDRILWGNNHFFRINCAFTLASQSMDDIDKTVDYQDAQNEMILSEFKDDPIQETMAELERQHIDDKEGALERQRVLYERQLTMLRSQLTPEQQRGLNLDLVHVFSHMNKLAPVYEENSRFQHWAQERWVAKGRVGWLPDIGFIPQYLGQWDLLS